MTSHYLNHCWLESLTLTCGTRGAGGIELFCIVSPDTMYFCIMTDGYKMVRLYILHAYPALFSTYNIPLSHYFFVFLISSNYHPYFFLIWCTYYVCHAFIIHSLINSLYIVHIFHTYYVSFSWSDIYIYFSYSVLLSCYHTLITFTLFYLHYFVAIYFPETCYVIFLGLHLYRVTAVLS